MSGVQTGAQRVRLEAEVAARRRQASLRVGAVGLAFLFGGGVAFIVTGISEYILLGAMGVGIGLLMAALLLVLRTGFRIPPNPPRT